jgi:AraC-like DNA-binding protein
MQIRPARLLDRFRLLRTQDPVELEQLIKTKFGVRRFDIFGGRPGFSASINHLAIGPIGIAFSTCNTRTEVAFADDDVVRLHIGLQGTADAKVGAVRMVVGEGGTCITPAYAELVQRFDAYFERLVVRFGEPALRRKLETVLGIDINSPLQFDATDRVRNPNINLLRELAFDIASKAETVIPDASPIVLSEMGQTWQLALLSGAPHNFSHLLAAESKNIAPWQVRRAVDYIESNWRKPLLIEDIAAAIEVSSRSLFKTFKTSMGVSPMVYVRKVRLKKANRMLLLATRETSVAGVAYACGFRNAGHFAKDYREAFGESPSVTLARSRTLMRSHGRIRA